MTLKAGSDKSQSTNGANFRISIRTVFLLSTVFCVGFVIFPFLPFVRPETLLSSFVLVQVVALVLSAQAKLGRYFVCFLGALLVSICLWPPIACWPSSSELLFNVILIGAGLCFSCVAVRYGHWSTKLITLIPLFFISAIALDAILYVTGCPRVL